MPVRRISNRVLSGFAWIASAGLCLTMLTLIGFLMKRGMTALNAKLFFDNVPWTAAVLGRQPVFDGIWPAVVGSFYLIVLASLIAVPLGMATGITLSEYASPNIRRWISLAVDILAGTPSIIMGLFGFTIILLLRKTLLPQARTCLLLSAVCIALLILPYIIRVTQNSLEAVLPHIRLIGPSCGFTQWQTICYLLLPLSSRGILSGVILGIGRAAEDTAVIMLTGVVAQAGIPQRLWDKFEAIPFHIYCVAAEYQSVRQLDAGFGSALILLAITGILFLAVTFLQRVVVTRYEILS